MIVARLGMKPPSAPAQITEEEEDGVVTGRWRRRGPLTSEKRTRDDAHDRPTDRPRPPQLRKVTHKDLVS